MSEFSKSPYNRTEWKAFRASLIERFGAVCARCAASGTGVKIHVHHVRYRRGCAPWEHPLEDLEIICQGCHAAEHGKVPPKINWWFISYYDAHEVCEKCDYCGTDIRHVYTIYHPDWGVFDVGEICCDKMTGANEAFVHANRRRSILERRDRFCESPLWKNVNNSIFRLYREFYCEILKKENYYAIKITRLRYEAVLGRERYLTIEAAKRRFFEFVDSGEAEKFFDSRKLGGK